MAAFQEWITLALQWSRVSLVTALALHAVLLWPTTMGAGQDTRCPWDQYYDDNVNNCGPCFEVCHAMEQTRTHDLCHSQCSEFLKRRQPSDRESGGLDSIIPDHSSSLKAGIIASVVIGVLAVITILGFFALRRRFIAHRAAAAHSINRVESQPALPMPETCEDVNAGDISLSLHSSAIAEANADNDALPEYGMAEIDPMAPSSAGGVFAHYSQHLSR